VTELAANTLGTNKKNPNNNIGTALRKTLKKITSKNVNVMFSPEHEQRRHCCLLF
jgi:hypothetical protein